MKMKLALKITDLGPLEKKNLMSSYDGLAVQVKAWKLYSNIGRL